MSEVPVVLGWVLELSWRHVRDRFVCSGLGRGIHVWAGHPHRIQVCQVRFQELLLQYYPSYRGKPLILLVSFFWVCFRDSLHWWYDAFVSGLMSPLFSWSSWFYFFSFDSLSFIRDPVSIVVAAGRGAKFPLSGSLMLSVREFSMFWVACLYNWCEGCGRVGGGLVGIA